MTGRRSHGRLSALNGVVHQGSDAHERALDGGEQIEGGGRIITRRPGQRVDTDHA